MLLFKIVTHKHCTVSLGKLIINSFNSIIRPCKWVQTTRIVSTCSKLSLRQFVFEMLWAFEIGQPCQSCGWEPRGLAQDINFCPGKVHIKKNRDQRKKKTRRYGIDNEFSQRIYAERFPRFHQHTYGWHRSPHHRYMQWLSREYTKLLLSSIVHVIQGTSLHNCAVHECTQSTWT